MEERDFYCTFWCNKSFVPSFFALKSDADNFFGEKEKSMQNEKKYWSYPEDEILKCFKVTEDGLTEEKAEEILNEKGIIN